MVDAPSTPSVFIGYRRSIDGLGELRPGGTRTAEVLYQFLSRFGFDAWFDRALSSELSSIPRVEWPQAIDRRIDAASVAIIVLSRGAELSAELSRELSRAHQQQKELLLSIDGAGPPAGYEHLQVLDFRDFDALCRARCMPILVRNLAARCGLPARWRDLEELLAAVADAEMPCYRLGNIELPVSMVHGIPGEAYGVDDVDIVDSEAVHHLRPEYPVALRNNYRSLLGAACKLHQVDPARLRDNPMVRLDDFEQLPEGPNDERGKLVLHFSRTSYLQIWSTNVAADVIIPAENGGERETVRQRFCAEPLRLEKSVLANNPGVETVLITDAGRPLHERRIILRQRGARVAGYRGWFQSSASGHFSAAHVDDRGVPSPFCAAIAEAMQEIDHQIALTSKDYRLFGICLKHEDLHPTFFGFAETPKSATELLAAEARDAYEGYKSAIELDARTIVEHIANHDWFPISALALLYTGIHFLGYDAMLAASREIGPVPAARFLWGQINALGDHSSAALA
jgi:hypothetical protein